jgi:hypothetical protein
VLHVGVEAGGYRQLCMVCAHGEEEPHHEALYVVLWDRDGALRDANGNLEGGMVRLCWAHCDELAVMLLDALAGE